MFLGRGGAILEGWTTLAAIAGMTERVRLGTIHLGEPVDRRPVLQPLASMLVGDHAAGGPDVPRMDLTA